jgi:mannose-6-phosphate isomerase-like protein (cupin superfamily)
MPNEEMPMSQIRRVVTGLDAGDKAAAVLDSVLPLKPGRSANPAAVLWITDSNPAGYSSQDTARPIGIPPPDNGSIFRVVEFLPTTDAEIAKIDRTHMTSVIGDKTPARGLPPKHPLVHRTRSVDYAIIVSGEIDMLLDDDTIHLKAGDVVVQQATNHAWINRSDRPCRIAFVLMDAKEP